MNTSHPSRRSLLKSGTLVSTLAATAPTALFASKTPSPRFKIGACDWSIGKMASTDAFDVAKEIGLDGLQVSLGTQANDMHLRTKAMQDAYRSAIQRTGVDIASLAIGELNRIPYKSDPRAEQWVSDSIDVCQALGREVVLLAFFGKGDLKGDKDGTDEVVRRLQKVAPKAEKAGVVLGIESWLNAEEHINIIDRVGSPAVKVYYDVANMEKMGYDIYSEIRWLGKQGQICEMHMKENGSLLGKGRVDFKKVRDAAEDIGYTKWLIIESARPKGAELIASYQENLEFLRGVFG